MDKDLKKLGQRIKETRLEHGWTQEYMATVLGISRPLVIRLEKGRGNLMDLTRMKIEKALRPLQVQAVA